MIEITKEICKKCGKGYDDTHIIPRAEFAPYYCEKCMEELDMACGGSWTLAVYQASHNRSPLER